MPSPHFNPQPAVKYCPICKGTLYVPDPENKPHCYKCYVCDWRFEINELERTRE